MKRGWFLLLALSVGLNAGLLYSILAGGRGVENVAAEPPPSFIDTPAAGSPGTPAAGSPAGLPEGSPGTPAAGSPARLPEGSPGGAPQCPPCDGRCEERLLRLTRNLRLSETQRAQMAQVLEASMPRIVAARGAVQETRRRVQAEYAGGGTDPARLHSAVRAMNAAQANLDSLVAETMMQEISVLTPEQKQRYVERLPWGRCPPGICSPGPPGPPGSPGARERHRGR